jgi:4-hydroxy-tetrahydrodipicolinate synthase
MTEKLTGVVTALVTPMENDKGDPKEDILRKLVDFQIDAGVHGLFILGTAGEGPKLDLARRKSIAEIIVDQAAGRLPVIVHIGSANTEDCVDLAQHAERIRATHVSAVGPWYYSYDLPALIDHYRAIADAVSLPVLVYNNNGRQGYNITAGMFMRIAEAVEGIVGVKDTSHSVAQIGDYYRLFGDRWQILIGGDGIMLPGLIHGAVGEVNTISNAFPKIPLEIYDSYMKGDMQKAREAQVLANKVRDLLKNGPYLTPYKEAVKLCGFDTGEISRPLRPMTAEEKEFLKSGLKELGLIS